MIQLILAFFAIGVLIMLSPIIIIFLIAYLIMKKYQPKQAEAISKFFKSISRDRGGLNANKPPIPTAISKEDDDIEKEFRRLDKILAEQDRQIESVNKARDIYRKTGDISAYSAFWDGIFASGGLKFNSRTWQYEPVRAYFLANRHDDAWALLNKYALKAPTDVAIYDWRIKILKKEERCQAAIEQILHKFGFEAMYSGAIDEDKFRRVMSPVCKKVSKELQVSKLHSIVNSAFDNGHYDLMKSRKMLKEYFLELSLIGKK